MDSVESVGQIIRDMERNYIAGNTTISRYVQFDMYETLNKIDAYINSVHVSGSQDSLGRDKPFFNIVTAARNIWFRATDIDRKDVKIRPTKSSQDLEAFLATIHLQEWMKKTSFGIFLNEWGRTLSTYGSVVAKFVEKDNELHPLVIPWNRIICDPISFDGNAVIEVLEFTPAQLKRQGYDKDTVELLLSSLAPREDLNKQKRDNRADYIKVYEIHGELPLAFITDKESDEETFVQQMHVVSYVSKKPNGRGNFKKDYEDFTLYRGKEKKSPYQKDDLITEDGRTLGIGAVEHLFEAQWMVNHSQKLIKDTLDFTSLLILQTSDPSLVGKNVLNSLIPGDILVHRLNEPLTQLDNRHDIANIQNFSAQWRAVGAEINGISEAMLGKNPASGTAWRQTEALLQESHSLFELMTENKGLALEKILRTFVLPYLKKGLNHSKELAATLSSFNINKIDSLYIPQEVVKRANKQIISQVLSGQVAAKPDYQGLAQQVQSEMTAQGNQRYFKPSDIPSKTWQNIFKDLEWDLEIDITGEQKDNQAAMETLNTALKIFTTATPLQLENPNFKLAFNRILELSGAISPVEIAQTQPFVPLPIRKLLVTMDYADTPPDVQRQIEQQEGLEPSQQGTQTPQTPQATPTGGSNALPNIKQPIIQQ